MPTVDSIIRVDLGLSVGPGLDHELALLVDILSHVFEALDDGFDSLLEPRTGQILIDLISLGLLAVAPSAAATTISPSTIAEPALIR